MITNLLLAFILTFHIFIFIYGMKYVNLKQALILYVPLAFFIFYVASGDKNILYIWISYVIIVVHYIYKTRRILKYNYKNIMIISLGLFTIFSNSIFYYMVNNQVNHISGIQLSIKENLIKTYNISKKEEKIIIVKIAKGYNENINANPIKEYKKILYKRISLYAISFWFVLTATLLYRHRKRSIIT